MPDVINPVTVEQQVMEVLNRISNGIRIRSEAYQAWLDADRAFDQAFAKAYVSSLGPAHQLKYAAELATSQERMARDVADVVYRDAERRGKALEAELSALQSILKSILATYGAAGVGER